LKSHIKGEGYYSLKKYREGENARPIERHEKNSKGKNIEVENKVCSSN
jgi:hypothetical protein